VAAQSLIERVVEIIVRLSDESAGMSVSNIAEALGMPPSAAHRLLTALARKGVVVQDETSKQYRLTLMLPALGMRVLSNLGFIEICQPTVDMLAQQTKELVRLAVVEGDSLIWVAKAQGARSVLRVDPMAGRDAIPHITAAGKAWLATLTNEEAVAIVSARGFGRREEFGPNLIDKVDALIADLDRCRKRGYATTYEEAEPGVAAVAAAINTAGHAASTTVGTISVAGPTARLRRSDLERLAPAVVAAARQLSLIWPARSYADSGHQPGAAQAANR
jgi:IclR family transcriptional regulator, acetate operon repressor